MAIKHPTLEGNGNRRVVDVDAAFQRYPVKDDLVELAQPRFQPKKNSRSQERPYVEVALPNGSMASKVVELRKIIEWANERCYTDGVRFRLGTEFQRKDGSITLRRDDGRGEPNGKGRIYRIR